MQDKAIIEIGKLQGDKNIKPYQNFIQNLFPRKNNYNIILVVFKFLKSKGEYYCEFEKVDFQNVSKKNYLKFAYRKGSARGGDITFTTKFGDIDKKFKIFYPKQIKDVIAFAKEFEEEEELKVFTALKKCLDKSGEIIKSELREQYESLDKETQKKSGFSVKLNGLGEKEYLDGFITIQKLLTKVGTSGKSEKYKVISEGHNEACSICLDKKPILHGFASPFKYATVDKTGLVSGFFKQRNNWKNYPICSDCALDFELGQKYVSQNLSKYFYGKNYYIIPKVATGSNPKLLNRALKALTELDYKEKEGEKIASKENFLMRKIAQEDDHNQYALNLLFYEENPTTKAIKIKLFLEQIFPSRFRELFVDIPKKINSNLLYKDAIIIKKEKKNLEFSFRILKTFFEKDFYEIIQIVFLGLPISQDLLFSKFMNLIRSNYNKSKTSDGFIESNYRSILKAIMTLSYLKELEIITNTQKNENMDKKNYSENSNESKKEPAFNKEKFLSFLDENKNFLDSDIKIGVFAVGIYIRFLLNLQYANMNKSTPFEKKFRGYNLNATLLKKLYLDAKHKISQYIKSGGFYTYSNLREDIINPYFISNEYKMKELSDDEISFYFVAGLEFANKFKNKNSKEDNDEK